MEMNRACTRSLYCLVCKYMFTLPIMVSRFSILNSHLSLIWHHYGVILARHRCRNHPALSNCHANFSDSKHPAQTNASRTSVQDTDRAIEPPPVSSGKCLTLLSINTTSWMLHKDSLLNCADILVVQETRLTSTGQRQNTKDMLLQGYNVLHGAPCPPVAFKKNGRSQPANRASYAGRQGGVAIFAKKCWPFIQCSRDVDIAALHKKARWTHAAVPLGKTGALSKRFLHIISFLQLVRPGSRDDSYQPQSIFGKSFCPCQWARSAACYHMHGCKYIHQRIPLFINCHFFRNVDGLWPPFYQ